MVLRNGQVIVEAWWAPEAADKPHVLWSLSKSFTSTAVGLAIEEGLLKLDDPVLKFFPEYAPAAPSENLKAMTVRDLLTMSTGHDTAPPLRPATSTSELRSDLPWPKIFLDHPVTHKPGTHFVYNSAATYMLSAIVQKVSGHTLVEYLKPRLFEPLGIKDPQWEACPQGVSIGGWGLYLCTEDIAKFGQLYLQKGKWNGKQLVPAKWIELATSKQVANDTVPNVQSRPDWAQGYGFQFWRCRHNAFRGDGRDGQFCIVLPDQNAVIVLTAKTGNMQAELNLVWDKLLPAFEEQPLPENAAGLDSLTNAVKDLQVRENGTEK
jgi:CubicO group peptidase (beta-lactamase class C family)